MSASCFALLNAMLLRELLRCAPEDEILYLSLRIEGVLLGLCVVGAGQRQIERNVV